MRLDPRKCLTPIIELAHGFGRVVEEAAGLQIVGGDDMIDLLRLIVREQALIITLEEVQRVGLSVSLNE